MGTGKRGWPRGAWAWAGRTASRWRSAHTVQHGTSVRAQEQFTSASPRTSVAVGSRQAPDDAWQMHSQKKFESPRENALVAFHSLVLFGKEGPEMVKKKGHDDDWENLGKCNMDPIAKKNATCIQKSFSSSPWMYAFLPEITQKIFISSRERLSSCKLCFDLNFD